MYRVAALATGLIVAASSAAGQAQTTRSIALVLDASGSMNARLPDGTTRITAAKEAVAALVGKLSASDRLALRAYGHQSLPGQKDCKDTALLVPFDSAERNKAAVVEKARGLRAQGFTPISYVLKLAAEDVGKEGSAARVVVLVSDGRETCEGDPCAVAKALAQADAALVVHTIGFGVDAAARRELRCIATAARGTYWDAASAGELAGVLAEAAKQAATPVKQEIVINLPNTGKLEVKGADRDGHDVIDAVSGRKIEVVRPSTGQRVDNINTLWPVVDVPPGLYNVVFGRDVWKSVEVKAGETTVLEPGILEIRPSAFDGHKVLETETGRVIAETSSVKQRVTLIPSRFSVTFGELVWPDVEVKPGATTTLRPGVIKVSAPRIWEYKVVGPDGRLAGMVRSSAKSLPVPAGSYTLEVEGRTIPVAVKEGEEVEIKLQ